MNDFEIEGEVLYDGNDIRVHLGKSADSYDVLVKDHHVFLDRGMLEDWLSGGIDSVEIGYKSNAKAIETGSIQEDLGVSSAEFAFALSQAKLKKVENERDYFQNKTLETITD